MIISSIPSGATPAIDAMDADMSQATAHVTATLERGGTQSYQVDFVRNGLGWVVSSLQLDFASDDNAQIDDSAAVEAPEENAILSEEDSNENNADNLEQDSNQTDSSIESSDSSVESVTSGPTE